MFEYPLNKTVLVTGLAGFIGYHTAKRLLDDGYHVVGVDNINDYYSVSLKYDRLAALGRHKHADRMSFVKVDISDAKALNKALSAIVHLDAIVHLAAQAGVRYSVTNPQAYLDSNVTGMQNVLDVAKTRHVEHLVYASSSSVYGKGQTPPFEADGPADHPVSMYAATKRMNELMAHVYAHQHNIPCTGLRFFTVYGPWGRPDMALMKFADAITKDETITLYNHGEHYRDFTYVDDVVEGIMRVVKQPPAQGGGDNSPAGATAPHRVYNVGAHTPVHLGQFVEALESAMGKTAKKTFAPMQVGDVVSTMADVSPMMSEVGYAPSTPLDYGIRQFVSWYKAYRNLR